MDGGGVVFQQIGICGRRAVFGRTTLFKLDNWTSQAVSTMTMKRKGVARDVCLQQCDTFRAVNYILGEIAYALTGNLHWLEDEKSRKSE